MVWCGEDSNDLSLFDNTVISRLVSYNSYKLILRRTFTDSSSYNELNYSSTSSFLFEDERISQLLRALNLLYSGVGGDYCNFLRSSINL